MFDNQPEIRPWINTNNTHLPIPVIPATPPRWRRSSIYPILYPISYADALYAQTICLPTLLIYTKCTDSRFSRRSHTQLMISSIITVVRFSGWRTFGQAGTFGLCPRSLLPPPSELPDPPPKALILLRSLFQYPEPGWHPWRLN